ncbi:TM2 domain-containing protein [Oerskovia flava]|uniref:TM2 domain-containing protein n=1 Tax=Oerskovia flava TaxID=2986422 RepID=UPI00223FA6DD|nr:TM2 domain-containing protein [Oerskovia sp. JB1-3-2]
MTQDPYQREPDHTAGEAGRDPQPAEPSYGTPPATEEPGQPGGGQPYGTPPNAGQPSAGQPGGPYAQGYPGQPYAQGYPGQPYGQGYPGQPYPAPGYGYEDPLAKSRLAAGLLGIFLGSIGVHRFYLGYTGIGLTMLLLTIVGSFVTFGLSAIAVSIWGLVEGILYLTARQGSYAVDSTGRPLRS